AELSFQYIAELGVKLRQCLLLAEAHTVRRVSNDDAFLSWGGDVQYVGLLEIHDFLQSGRREISAGCLEHICGQITAVNGQRYPGFLPGRALFAQLPPTLPFEIFEFLESEMAPETRCDIKGHVGCFQQDRAAAAHGIEQRSTGGPTSQAQNSGGEIFPKRRLSRGQALAALEQRLPGGV